MTRRPVTDRPVTCRWRRARGSAGVGMALGASAMVMIMLFGVGALRLTRVNGEVSAASRAAARAAVASQDQGSAVASAEAVVDDVLGGSSGWCQQADVLVDGDWSPGSTVAVTVSCTVDLSDVVFAGFPSDRTVHRTSVEYVDTLRADGGR